MLTSSAVDHRFESWSGQTKDYKICICCFSAKHTALRSKSKDWLARNQDNVSEWNDIPTHRLLFQGASTLKKIIQTQHVGLAQSRHHLIECNVFLPWYSWKIDHLVIKKQPHTYSLINCEMGINTCRCSTLYTLQLLHLTAKYRC